METPLRIALIYLFILIGLRAIGKRSFSQMSPFDLVTLLLIPEIAQQAMMREDFSMTNAFLGLSTLFVLVFLTSAFTHWSQRVEQWVDGTPTLLVSEGEFLSSNMNGVRVSSEEVYAEMHQAGLSRLDQVRWAVLETDGKISFIPYEQSGPEVRRAGSKEPMA